MTAEVVTTVAACREILAPRRRSGDRIGLVPTMGALHEGHLSLVEIAAGASDVVVVSVFVNPTQFGPGEDYERYPRDLDRDVRLASERGAAIVFAPSVEEMYPEPSLTRITLDGIADRYEGAARPGHLDGVLTVVSKLFHIVQPDVAVFGRKDAQQATAVRRMVRDLDMPVEIVVAPTIRESDGLAASSRNAYLDDGERQRARAIHRALSRAASLVDDGETRASRLEAAMGDVLGHEPGIEIEYAAIVDRDTFEAVDRVDDSSLAVIAARVGPTRLIDNVPLESTDDGR